MHLKKKLLAFGESDFQDVCMIVCSKNCNILLDSDPLKNICWQMEKWRFWCMLDMCHRSLACWKRRCMIRKQFWHTELLAENRLIYVHRYRDGSAWSCTWNLDFGFYKFHHEDLLAWSFSKIRFCDAWKSNFRYLICHYQCKI